MYAEIASCDVDNIAVMKSVICITRTLTIGIGIVKNLINGKVTPLNLWTVVRMPFIDEPES